MPPREVTVVKEGLNQVQVTDGRWIDRRLIMDTCLPPKHWRKRGARKLLEDVFRAAKVLTQKGREETENRAAWNDLEDAVVNMEDFMAYMEEEK